MRDSCGENTRKIKDERAVRKGAMRRVTRGNSREGAR
jgi:hypothetical protein